MVKYKAFIKKFIWWYVGANIVIAILLAIFMPNIISKILSGKEVTVSDITNTIASVDKTPITRVKTLGASVGLDNVIIKECPNDVKHNILACYIPQQNITYVTQLGLTQTDTMLLCTLRHEAIHKMQDDTGKIQYDSNGNITNSAAMETEAYTNDGC